MAQLVELLQGVVGSIPARNKYQVQREREVPREIFGCSLYFEWNNLRSTASTLLQRESAIEFREIALGILITKIVSWRHGSHKKLSFLPKFPAMFVVEETE